MESEKLPVSKLDKMKYTNRWYNILMQIDNARIADDKRELMRCVDTFILSLFSPMREEIQATLNVLKKNKTGEELIKVYDQIQTLITDKLHKEGYLVILKEDVPVETEDINE